MHRNESKQQARQHPGHQHGSAQQYSLRHDFDGTARLTTTLAHAISDVTGIDVTDTERTLTDHVDPSALDSLFKPTEDGTPRANGQLSFVMWGHQVTVYSDGQIRIAPPQQTPHARV